MLSQGTVALLLFGVSTFCLFYIMAALSRFNAQILEFKLYRDAKIQDDNSILTALQISVKTSDEKLAVVFAQFEQLKLVVDQSALQLKALREDHFTLSSNLDVRFNAFSKQVTDLIEHFNDFQDGLSQFSQGLQTDNTKIHSVILQLKENLDSMRDDTV